MIELSFPTRKLKGLIKRVNIKFKNSNDFTNREIIVYGVTNKEGITITGNNTSEDLSNYLVLKENQFAYNPYRINVGSLGLSKKSTLGLISPAYVIFETKDGLDAEFLLYYLKSNLGLNLIKWYGDRGGVRSALRYTDLENIDIPDLNIEQQRNVLKKLKLVESQLKEFDMSCERQLNYLKSLKDTILQDAVQGKLVEQNPDDEPASVLLERIRKEKEKLIKENKIKKEKQLPEISEEEIPHELPKGWEWGRIGTFYHVTMGQSPESYTYNEKKEGIPFYQGKSEFGKIHPTPKKWCSKPKKIAVENDILISVRAPIGPTNISKEECCIGRGLASIRCLCESDNYYLLYVIRAFERDIAAMGVGSTFTAINSKSLKNYIIPIAPVEEQKRIVEKVNSLMVLCDALEKKIEEQKQYNNKLMESIIKSSLS